VDSYIGDYPYPIAIQIIRLTHSIKKKVSLSPYLKIFHIFYANVILRLESTNNGESPITIVLAISNTP
jgi:hypothetical protein